MDGKLQGELILFPKTIDYYQIQLTRLLEAEAYGEAIRLLEFLVECKTDDDQTNVEWHMLLNWLRVEFSDERAPGGSADGRLPEEPADAGESEDESASGEEELRRRYAVDKAAKDAGYVGKLLETLEQTSMDKQLLALDQLAYVDADGVSETLRARLSGADALHPFVSFKLLQTLRRRGVAGEASFVTSGETVTVDIGRTPLAFDKFPDPLPRVNAQVQLQTEADDPTIAYFAGQTWEEFLIYIYGTSRYRSLVRMTEAEVNLWACALHAAVAMAMYGAGESGELRGRYGIAATAFSDWEQAYGELIRFFRDSSGLRV